VRCEGSPLRAQLTGTALLFVLSQGRRPSLLHRVGPFGAIKYNIAAVSAVKIATAGPWQTVLPSAEEEEEGGEKQADDERAGGRTGPP